MGKIPELILRNSKSLAHLGYPDHIICITGDAWNLKTGKKVPTGPTGAINPVVLRFRTNGKEEERIYRLVAESFWMESEEFIKLSPYAADIFNAKRYYSIAPEDKVSLNKLNLKDYREEYENAYEVTRYGEIWNTWSKRIIKPRISIGGYYRVGLPSYRNGAKHSKHFSIHRLVALAFVHNDDPETKTVINHIDGNKLNNRWDNLEWCTVLHNTHHAIANGWIDNSDAVPDDTVEKICRLLEEGHNGKYIAKETGVKKSYVERIHQRMTRTNISDKYKWPLYTSIIPWETICSIKDEYEKTGDMESIVLKYRGIYEAAHVRTAAKGFYQRTPTSFKFTEEERERIKKEFMESNYTVKEIADRYGSDTRVIKTMFGDKNISTKELYKMRGIKPFRIVTHRPKRKK